MDLLSPVIASLQVAMTSAFGVLQGAIERRGHHSQTLPEKSFSFNLYESYSLAGLRKDDDWILLSLSTDPSLLQSKLALELFPDWICRFYIGRYVLDCVCLFHQT